MDGHVILTLKEIEDLASQILEKAGTTAKNARSVAHSIKLAERDGLRSHGLLYLPIYASHVLCGKVDGQAIPVITRPRPAHLHVDAVQGFAHPAIDAGMEPFIHLAKQQGIAALTLHNSYNCGVLGHHAERIALNGLIGLCMTHAPASIAPIGGKTKLIGTNPIAFSVPDGQGGVALTIDQSASVVAKSEILLRASKNEPLEPDWALDESGQPTTDPQAALKGTMLPAGGYKGFNIGLIGEILASCLSGSVASAQASSFADIKGGPPRTGQCFIALDPAARHDGQFFVAIDTLTRSITQQQAHLPGDHKKSRRQEHQDQGVPVPKTLLERIDQAVSYSERT